jgi:tyrosine-protein kinase Etk/Wzc
VQNGVNQQNTTGQLNGNIAEPSAYDRIQKYWWLIKRRLWLVILFAMIGAIYKYNEILNVQERFSSVSTVILDGSSTDRAVALLGIPGARYGYQNEIYILRSDRLSQRVAENLIENFQAKQPRDTLGILKAGGSIASIQTVGQRLRGSVRFINEEEQNIIRIQGFANDPNEAAQLSNAFAKTYEEFNRDESVKQIRETKEFLRKKIEETSDSLIKFDREILDFYRTNDFSNYDLSTESLIKQVSALYEQLDQVQIELISNREEIRAIDSTLNSSRRDENSYLVNVTDKFIELYSEKITELEIQKEEELTALTSAADSTNPRIQVINDKLDVFRDKLRFHLERKLDNTSLLATVDGSVAKYWIELNARKMGLENMNRTLPVKKKEIQQQIADYNTRLEKIPFKQIELDKLQRKRQRFAEANTKFYNRFIDMDLAEASEGGYVTILDSAKPNYNPINKQATTGVFQGLFAGIALAIGIIVGLDKIDDRIKSDEDVVDLPVNVLGGIPTMKTIIEKDFNGKRFVEYKQAFISTRLLTILQPLSGIAEMYRRLRSDFQFSLPDKHSKSILVSSANPQEGKSVTAANLSIVLAQSGKKVLLVDADLRRPNVEVIFGLSGEGLTDFIIGNAGEDDIIRTSVVDNLNIVCAGTQVPNPSELLGSEAFKRFYDQVIEEYDFVVIDSPPINSVVDAVTMSDMADLMLLVVRAGKTKKKEVMKMLNVLHRVHTKIKGILLNDINQKSYISDYNYYSNYNYYGSRPADNVRPSEKKQGNFWDRLNA